MLYISLVLSLIVLGAASAAARSQRPVLNIVLISAGLIGFSTFFIYLIPLPVVLQSLLLAPALAIWKWRLKTHPSAWFLPFSLTATAVAFACCAGIALTQQHRYDQLRHDHPFESMEGRLPVRPIQEEQPVALARLVQFEEKLTDNENSYRARNLRRLHEETVSIFVNSPGFGVTRMPFPTEYALRYKMRDGAGIPQPGQRPVEIIATSQADTLRPVGPDAKLEKLHLDSVLDFVHVAGFGYFKDRYRVAGFQSHQFSHVPMPAERWKVQTLELIGLVIHEEPVAYVSENLPRMDELRTAKTRGLGRFEREGLDALRQGEALVVRRSDEWLRMLGEIRSGRQCVTCHGGTRGDLLGAFSYVLRRTANDADSKRSTFVQAR